MNFKGRVEMKKVIAILLITMLAASSVYADGPVDKLGRGLANIVTSPFELAKGMADEGDENGMFAGWTVGILKGLIGVVKRAGVGAFETVTFPVPVPAGYKPILTDPTFFDDSTIS